MAVPVWQPGTLYNPGALVRPASAPPVQQSPPTNPGFEDGDTGWDMDAMFSILPATGDHKFTGTWSAEFDSPTSIIAGRIWNDNEVVVVPGLSITARCQVQQGASPAGGAGGRVEIDWLTSGDVLISTSQGNMVDSGSGGAWHESVVTAVAPAGAAKARIAASAFRITGGDPLWLDAFSWNYSFQPSISTLIFRAVQPDAGFSASNEPTWPTTLGVQVIDNEVIWEAVDEATVTWEAEPILVSGYDEPIFPETPGGTVADGSIIWVAITRRIDDERCPNTPIVAIAASKIFCADDDIIAFSATVNPRDWSTADDAGYLPFGLQTYGSNPVAALGLYRSNLIAFNAEGFQMWQVDQDPANMAFLDGSPVGCTYTLSLAPVQNDLVFLTGVGIRNIGIAGASTNLQAGTFGEAIDPLVIAKIRAAEFDPHAVFIPSYGQYWLFFGDEAFVLSITDVKRMSWSRYTFPEAITDTALLGNDLYLRTSTDKVWKLSDLIEGADDHFCEAAISPRVMFGYFPASGDTAGILSFNSEGGAIADASIDTGGSSYPTAVVSVGASTWIAATGTGQIWRSTDNGVNWTEVHEYSGGGDFWNVGYNGTTYVVMNSNDGTPLTSPDGITWTERTPVADFFPDYLVYNEAIGLFAAADDDKCFTSPDGITWTERTVPYGGEIQSGGDYFIIWNSDDVNYRIAFSDDGITWSDADTGVDVQMTVEAEQIVYNTDGNYWVVSENGRAFKSATAAPDSAWSEFAMPAGTGLPTEMGNATSISHIPDYGTVWALQAEDDGDDLIYRNDDDTAGGWTLLHSASTLSLTGLFIASFSYASEGGDCTQVPFEGVIHWPFLDFNALGVEKQFVGFDLVADAPEGVSISIGYDQRDRDSRTDDYLMDADSLPGKLVPIVVSGPSFDVRLTFEGEQAWEWEACNIYINDMRMGS